MEGTHAFKAAAVKQKEDDESQASRSCGKRKLCQIVAIILLLIAQDFIKLRAQKRAFERVQKKAHVIDKTVHCYGDPAYAMFAVEVSPLSAAYSDSLYETAGACGLRDEAIQHHAKYSKGGRSWLYVSEWKDDEPGDKLRYIPGILRRMVEELRQLSTAYNREHRRKQMSSGEAGVES